MFITSASGLICKTGFYFISFGHKNGVLFFFDETMKLYFFINMTTVGRILYRKNNASSMETYFITNLLRYFL